jgi:acyl transferase domain-containing protein/acyl carrier protein
VCEPFGADADGTVLGEGAGVVVLRPLADALTRGDRIYGVIKGSGLSTGSGTVGFTAPNPQAQSEAVRRSLRAARIDPRTVSYIETHGTGTLLGDPIEIRGLTLAYGDVELQEPGVTMTHRCAIGSVKPNIGHLEAGAGVLGLIKILLQLRHRTLVPSLTSAEPSPQIPFGQVPFAVQRRLADWPQPVRTVEGQTVVVPRRAGLNSFGVGGANAHLIVEEAPVQPAPALAPTADRSLHVLALSGVNDAALERQVQRLAAFVEASPELNVANVCYTVNTGRRHLSHRRGVVAGERGDLIRGLRAAAGRRGIAASAPPRIAFLFTGQGSQYAGMGKALYESQPVFRAALDRCARVFDALLDRSLLDLLLASEGSPDAELLHQTGYTQPALFSFQYALAELWRWWEVVPDVVMGHSVGEIAAMCVAGGVSLEDGLTLIAARGRLMQALPAGGVMTSVMADEARVQAAIESLGESVAIAAVNGPGQVVISGAGAAVAEISARLGADGIKTRALTVSHAFHSPLMKPMLADYEREVRGIRFEVPHTPLVSCVEGAVASDQLTRPDYWLRQVLDPVRFDTGMRVLESQGVGAYVEIGPHPVLIGMGRQCVADESAAAWVPSVRRDADHWRTMLEGVGELYERGVDVDWAGFDAPYARTRVVVPSYAFSDREYWLKDVRALEPDLPQGKTASRPSGGPQYYDLNWQLQPAPAAVPRTSPVTWALFVDEAGVGRALAQRLEDGGATVVVVERGSAYGQNRALYRINPDDPSHYVRLVTDLAGGPADPGLRIVHLWSLDAPANDLLGSNPAAAVSAGVSSVAFLTRAVAGAASSMPIAVVTQGAVGLADDVAPPSIAQAAVWGMGRTIALEHPEVWAGLIDVESAEPSRVAARLAFELQHDSSEDQVVLRDRGRFVARLVQVPDLPASEPALSPEGLYLVTGGLGALGLQAAQWLVSRGARHLVLASRTADAARSARVLAGLRSGAITVDVVAADVSRADDVNALLTRIANGGHPLRGVVHAAGIDATIPVEQLTASQIREALAAKAGGWLLHERTRQMPLDLFVCFSSMASVLGAQGRGHYAAANALLDGLAAERQRLKLPVTSVNWGPWRGGGMATEEHLQQFERVGNRGLEPAAALHALDAAVAGGRSQIVVADIDWELFGPAYQSRRPRPVLASVGTRMPSEVQAVARAPWHELLGGMSPGTRETALAELVQREVAETMGFDGVDSVPLERNFYEMGVDSLMMADLLGRLRRQVGFSCSGLVFDQPTVRGFSRQLLPRLFPLHEAGDGPPTANESTISPAANAGIDQQLEAEILRFQYIAFPTRQAELVPSRWRWMFVESARRLGVRPQFWVHRENGGIVGQKGFIPVRLKAGQQTVPTGWLVETMVLDAFRHHAVGSRLMSLAHDDQPFSLSLGQSAEMREIQLRLGWVQVAPLQIGQRVINPAQVLSGKMPRPAAWAAVLGLKASTLMRDLVRDRRQTEVREIAEFTDVHDRLWHQVAAHYQCAVVRDASYLNWKYVHQPGQEFLRLAILEDGRLLAIAVWMFRPPDAQYRYGRAFLVDLVAPLSDAAMMERVVAAACAAVEGDGVDALFCHHTDGRLTRALRTCGFLMRKPERFLLVDADGLRAEAKAVVLDPGAWFVTQGDSDIDRPW